MLKRMLILVFCIVCSSVSFASNTPSLSHENVRPISGLDQLNHEVDERLKLFDVWGAYLLIIKFPGLKTMSPDQKRYYFELFYKKFNERFQEALKEKESNPASQPALFETRRFDVFNHAYGQLALASGHHDEALSAFKRIINSQSVPNHSEQEIAAQIGLAQALQARGQINDSLTVLQDAYGWANKLENGKDLKKHINALFSSLKVPDRKSVWQGTISAKTGYDSNVNTSTDDTSISYFLPSGGVVPLKLTPESRAQASPFGGLNLSGFGSIPVWNTATLFAQVSLDGVNNTKVPAFNTRTLSAAIGANYLFGSSNEYELVLPFQVQHLWLNGNIFADALIGVADLNRRFSPNTKAGLYGEHDALLFKGASSRNLNINLGGLAWTQDILGLKSRVVSKVFYGQQRPMNPSSTNDNLGRNFYGLNVQAQWRGSEHFLPYAGLVLQKAKHLGVDRFFSKEARNETFVDASLGVTYSSSPESPWKFNLQYDNIVNYSNISLHTYKRQLVSLGGSYTFGS